MQVVAGSRGTAPDLKPMWLPFYNYIPLITLPNSTPYIFTEQSIGNINQTKWAFQLSAQRDSGILWVSGRAMDGGGNYQDSWVILPPESFTDADSGQSVGLPVGYCVTVINDSGGSLYVVPYSTTEHGVGIVDSNQNLNWYCSLNGTMTDDTYIFLGPYAGGKHWRALHDT